MAREINCSVWSATRAKWLGRFCRVGSEEAWKRYYECRSKEEADSEADKDDSDGSLTYLNEWKEAMADRIEKCMVEGINWHWTPWVGDLEWSDYNELREAEYFTDVWSPFAIPHAIKLFHRYFCAVGMNSISFHTMWSYHMVDFEDEDSVSEEINYKKLCSNHYGDEELRADVINTSNLNEVTYRKLRKFLFGTSSEGSEAVTCSAIDFWYLIFGSMGTTDLDLATDPKRGDLGYKWRPTLDRKMRKKLFDLKAREGDDEEVTTYDNYYPSGCSWLKHRVLEITGNLGPVTSHYQHPTIRDAPGYRSPEEDYDGEWY